ncbi:NAD(P)/FAD-dependent oxidoreductase [Novosphingobium profundi]|uniref:FAD-dependent oxidoreductase n=1 Tax=Novosphingobium profundi TaxID=1774954 RepID=UPI001BDA3DCC|nr:NAD(P)/FAD-dependent oxidoreductase [Novosphingobium profundi]MBT0668196.1 NAD(P)/FAD-dependent oxidoreductase [Novosphingobium profundi]
MSGLAALEARLERELELIAFNRPQWVRPRRHAGEEVLDVAVIGGGQCGLATAFGLRREGVTNVMVFDESAAGYEGPWETYARMVTLRTPKTLTPIDFGVPSLTYQAWWEAQHGREAWDALDKIARGDWMDYLRWYRRVLDLPVVNEAKLQRIEPLVEEGLHRLHFADGGVELARKVVLATGIQGGGEWHTPALVRENLPRDLWAHTSEPIDFATLHGKRIGILGGGASAFDNAQFALSQGVEAAEVFIRRKQLPRINPIRFMEKVGFAARYPALDDQAKYAAMACFLGHNQPPTNDTFVRAASFAGFHLHTGAPWLDVCEHNGLVRVTTPQGHHEFDFVIVSTGLVSDPALRPELAGLADCIARWGERVTPTGPRNALIDAHPYLGNGFEFLPRDGVDGAPLHGLFAFNYSALISLGLSASALSGLHLALPRLLRSIADQLFLDDKDVLLAEFLDYDVPEFLGEWPLPEMPEAGELA